MKKVYNILFFAVALLAVHPVVKAETDEPPYKEANHIAYSKTVTGPENGIYTIHLDTFVTGEKSIVESSIPADIVLVLDVSGSMTDNIRVSRTYTARSSQDYTYNNYGNNTYYYRHTDGEYYPVRRTYFWLLIVTSYALQVDLPDGTYYLSGNGITGTRPWNVWDSSTTIWNGVLYTRTDVTKTKIQALKDAVGEFVDAVQRNNDYLAGGTQPRPTPLGNQIAIVKYARNAYYGTNGMTDQEKEESLAEGNHLDNNNYNYTEVVKQFKNLNDAGSAQELKDAVNEFQAGGATAADFGMRKAELLLNDLNEKNPDRQSNKTVVLFTDGDPTYQSNFSETVANSTIKKAKTIKGIKAYTDSGTDVFTTVFTIGVFDNASSNTNTYMNYVSSNYPTAEAMNNYGDGGNDQGYYQNASKEDLSAIFRSVAAASGGSGATTVTATAATTVDVVSQSFQLPEGATGDIHVYFANCSGVDDKGFLTFDEEHKMENPEDENDPMHVTITVVGDKITATGFDYSANWCGRDETSQSNYHGMKLMIEIPIEMSDDAVGGINVGTNGPGSGIFIDGSQPLIYFEEPHVSLPTNLHIKKEGMGPGECATFEIFRKKLDPKEGESADWETTPFKTVIVICGLNDNTVKLMGLDPHYLYKIVEKANWNWSYDFDKITDADGTVISQTNEVTSDLLITNPFIFVNKTNSKNASIRHAESAVSNDFRNSGKQEGISSKNPPQNTTPETK